MLYLYSDSLRVIVLVLFGYVKRRCIEHRKHTQKHIYYSICSINYYIFFGQVFYGSSSVGIGLISERIFSYSDVFYYT